MTPDPPGSAPPGDEFERPAEEGPKFDVFLAYNSEDDVAVACAQTIFDALEKEGKRIWAAWSDAIPGEPSNEIMVNGIASSRCCAMLHGPKGLGRWQSTFELKLAIQETVERRGFRVFAVLLPGSGSPKELPDDLRISSVLDLRELVTDQRLTDEGLIRVVAAAERKSPREVWEARKASEAESADEGPGRNRALLISVGKYSDPALKELHGPPVDAVELRKALENARMPHGSEWEITSCPDPDLDKLGGSLRDFFRTEDLRGGTALFYYSGHGLIHSNESYVCATNTDTADVSWTAMPATKIVDLVKQCPAHSKVVILDCCQAAGLVSTAYEQLGDDVAVVLASRGPTEDATTVLEPSPFTRKVVEVFGDPRAYGIAGLTMGDLLAALDWRGEKPWTNRGYARDIVLAAPAQRPEPPPKESAPAIAIELSAATPEDDRLPLVRQLAATLDGLLAVAREERQIPTGMVSQTMHVLAGELRRLTHDQLEDLEEPADEAPGKPPKTCAVSFADEMTRRRLADLPWEYLALCGRTREQQLPNAHDRLRSPRMSIERLFEVPATKYAARTAIQNVVLFSSLVTAGDEDVHPLTAATEAQLKQLALKSDVLTPAKWPEFSVAPDNADVVIVHAPVWLKDGEVKVVFAGPRPDAPNDVAAAHVIRQLQRRSALTWMLIETVADDSRYQTGLAVRQLADSLASQLKRPVVAISHSRAYLNCLRENPGAETFLANLLRKLAANWALDHAAHAARESVVSSLALNDPSIIGFPVVMRPVERETPAAERALARR